MASQNITTFTLKEISERLGLVFKGDPDTVLSGVAELKTATPTDVSFYSTAFLSKGNKQDDYRNSHAGAFCVSTDFSIDERRNYLIARNPDLAFQEILTLFHGRQSFTGFTGIHPTAVIHPSAILAKDVSIGPYAVIDQDVIIGERSVIGPSSYIGMGSQIGRDCLIHAHVCIRENCVLGDRTIIQPGAVIGSCGFGYIQNAQGQHVKTTHLGKVTVGNDVEIGANTAVDRGRFISSSTTIKSGTKIDNLVQIAHNVEIGEHNIIAGQTGLAGSVKTAAYVMMGGQVGVDHHVSICSMTQIAGRSGVSKSINRPGKYGGVPALPLERSNRIQVCLRQIEKFAAQLAELQRKVSQLDSTK
ncbi:MAG: UDP-3-O-(3-hydroxymyristoyl)glucosamine N-acyltransferase [Chlamydiales bacterium]